MSKKKRVPDIRFEGFEGEWVNLKVSDALKVNSGRDYKHLNQGDIPVYGTGGYMLSVDEPLSKQDAIGIGRKGTIDVPQKLSAPFWTVDTLFYLTQYENYNLSFLFSLMETVPWRSLDESTGVPSLSRKQIDNVGVVIPKIKEQFKIGYYFERIDNSIDLKKQGLISLKNVKQAMLQKMFPKEGETVPEIRFEGFEGKWKEGFLNDVAKITMGQSPSGKNYTANPNDHILVQGNADIKDNQVVPRVWTTQVTKVAIPGDIIMSVRAPVGDVGKTKYKVVLGRGVAGIRGNDFVYFYLEYLKENNYWDKLSTGSTFQSINSNHLNNLALLLPSKNEQKIIGDYFYKLDNNIQSKQSELDKLAQFKQAMLDKMFV